MAAKRIPGGKSSNGKDSFATIGFEAKLWLTADKLRNNMDAAEYSRTERDRLADRPARRVGADAPINHVVLDLIFLNSLATLRDTLLPKLLSGELSVAAGKPVSGKPVAHQP